MESLRAHHHGVSGAGTYASYTYDLAGNLETRSYPGTGESWDFAYDGKNQLRRATRKLNGVVTGSEEYWYNENGARQIVVKRDASGAKTGMIWFFEDVEAHYDGNNPDPTQIYTHVSMGTPVGRIEHKPGNTSSLEYQFHGLASNTLATIDNATGTVNASFVYAPFGETIEATDGGAISNAGIEAHRRRMNDKYVDEATGLAYYGVRYYDNLSMTWTQSDPLYRFAPDAAPGEPRRAQLYTMSLNNPIRYIDPDGRSVGSLIGNAIDAVGQGLSAAAPYASAATRFVARANPILAGVTIGLALTGPFGEADSRPLDDSRCGSRCEGPNSTTDTPRLTGRTYDRLAPPPPIQAGHRKNKRRSNREKHQKGDERRGRDKGGEKADPRRRPPRNPPKDWKGPWPPPVDAFAEAPSDETTTPSTEDNKRTDAQENGTNGNDVHDIHGGIEDMVRRPPRLQ